MRLFFEKINNLLSKRIVIFILSVIIAVVAWFAVMESTNPIVDRTITVNIEFKNFEKPAENNLTLVSELGIVSAEITISGRSSLVNNVLPSDLSLSADFSKIDGTGNLFIPVEAPICDKLGVNIKDYYPKQISVNYDRQMEMYLPVKLDFTSSIIKSGYEIVSIESSPDSIPIRGFESDLEGLEYIKVNLSDTVENGTIDQDKKLTFIGRYITDVGTDVTAKFEQEKISVDINVAKRVPVVYKIVGALDEDYFFISDNCKISTVLVDGSTQELLSLKEINLGNIDISSDTESGVKSFRIQDYLSPQLYSIDGTTSIDVNVEIGKLVTKSFYISTSDITQVGRNDDKYIYDLTFDEDSVIELSKDTKLVVKLKGKNEELNQINAKSLNPTIVFPSEEGLYRNKEIKFTVPDNVKLVGNYFVDIDVQLKPSPTPVFTETPVPTATLAPTIEPTEETTQATE